MITNIQTNFKFVDELRRLGVEIPEDCVKITLNVKEYDKPAYWVFHQMSIGNPVVKKSKVGIYNPDGSALLCQDFFKGYESLVKMPDDCSGFSITCSINEVVTMNIEAPVPVDSLQFLLGFKFM